MAVYEYEIIDANGQVRAIYEAEQKMSEAALTQHPVTGERLRRVLSRTFTRAESSGSSSSSGDCATGTCGLGDYGTAGGCASGMCGWN